MLHKAKVVGSEIHTEHKCNVKNLVEFLNVELLVRTVTASL
jgi:hypothetical protein